MAELNYQKSEDRKYERSPFLRKLFGPSQEEMWNLLALDIGANFEIGGFWKGGSKVTAEVGEWTVTLDTYTVSTGKSSVTYTRMRAPYVNRDGLRFSITRAGVFDPIAKWFGAQDVEIGDETFDKAFVIKSNNEPQAKLLLADPKLRELIAAHKHITFAVIDDEGWFGKKFPEGVDELRFSVVGVIKDLVVLRQLFELFALTLHRLCHIGSAYENDPGLTL